MPGFVSIPKDAIEWGIFQDVKLWKIFTWCLITADENGNLYGCRDLVSAKTGISPATCWRDIAKLVRWGYLEKTPARGGIVLTIANWELFKGQGASPAISIERPRKEKLSQFRDVLAGHSSRAAEYGVPDTLTLRQWGRLLDSTGWACAVCGRLESIVVEHMIPMSRGGPNSLQNVCPMCSECNSSKGRKTPLEWIWWRACRG